MATKSGGDGRVVVENVNVPGYSVRLDAGKYEAMRKALMAVVPKKGPGLTQGEIREAVVGRLPEALFPGGTKAGWWAKMVQLDLEAKGVLEREGRRPVRWCLRRG